MSGPTRVIVGLAATGFVASSTWHVLTLVGRELPPRIWWPLFVGMFVVWLPAVLSLLPLNDRFRESPRDFWKIALEGAPTWMAVLAVLVGIYAIVNFVLTTGQLTGRVTSDDERFPRVGSAFAMVFYGAGMAILYSAGMRDSLVRCSEGHVVYHGQAICPVCGQATKRNAAVGGHGA